MFWDNLELKMAENRSGGAIEGEVGDPVILS